MSGLRREINNNQTSVIQIGPALSDKQLLPSRRAEGLGENTGRGRGVSRQWGRGGQARGASRGGKLPRCVLCVFVGKGDSGRSRVLGRCQRPGPGRHEVKNITRKACSPAGRGACGGEGYRENWFLQEGGEGRRSTVNEWVEREELTPPDPAETRWRTRLQRSIEGEKTKIKRQHVTAASAH